MKKFKIKSSLAAGLAHRLNTLEAQTVVDATGLDAIKAIRFNQRIADKIKESNFAFEKEVEQTEKKKRAVFTEIQAKFDTVSKDLDEVAKQKMGRELTAEFNKQAAEIQKESKADPEEIVTVELGDDDYFKVLLPVFKKTIGLWDVEGNGGGQKLFLEVANALEDVETY